MDHDIDSSALPRIGDEVCLAYRFARVIRRQSRLVVVQSRLDPEANFVDIASGKCSWDQRTVIFAWPRAAKACMDEHCKLSDAWDMTHAPEMYERRKAYRKAIAQACGSSAPMTVLDDAQADTEASDRVVEAFVGILESSYDHFSAPGLEALADIPVFDENTASESGPPVWPTEPEEPILLVAAPKPASPVDPAPAVSAAPSEPLRFEDRLSPILPCGVGGTVGSKNVPMAAATMQHLGLVLEVGDEGVLAQCVGKVQTARNAIPTLQKGKVGEGLWLSRRNVMLPPNLAVGDLIRLSSSLRLNDTAKVEVEQRVIDHVMSQDGLLVLPNF